MKHTEAGNPPTPKSESRVNTEQREQAAIERRWSQHYDRNAGDYTDEGCRVLAQHAFRDVKWLLARLSVAEQALEKQLRRADEQMSRAARWEALANDAGLREQELTAAWIERTRAAEAERDNAILSVQAALAQRDREVAAAEDRVEAAEKERDEARSEVIWKSKAQERAEALEAALRDVLDNLGGHDHWREGGAGGRCKTCVRQSKSASRARAVLAPSQQEEK